MTKNYKKLLYIGILFVVIYFLPVKNTKFVVAIGESLYLAKWYAREHVLLCLVPAFFIAGAISVFVSQASVIKYLGAKANKIISYSVASVSGTILAVCSCTVLPLFAGIYNAGAGIGPATAFLYSGPAINVLAIVFTARVLGIELGIARAVGAIVFSIVIGVLMQIIYRKDNRDSGVEIAMCEDENPRTLGQNALYFASMVGILVFANWAKPEQQAGVWFAIFRFKWLITAIFSVVFLSVLAMWFKISKVKIFSLAGGLVLSAVIFRGIPEITFTIGFVGLSVILATSTSQNKSWFHSSVDFAIKIIPLLFIGVLIAGFLLGSPTGQGIIPSRWVAAAVGGNSIRANFFASIAGAFMYFATLTEVPILKGLIASGMGRGPALALLLAGPALSLPNMLVIRSIMGTSKTVVFVGLVIVMATLSGIIFGTFF